MKKKLLFITLFFVLAFISFSNNLFFTYLDNGNLKIDYNFNFEATNLYVANVSFYIVMKPENKDYIEVSSIDEILNYLKFYQPGFSINYKYKENNFNDPNYFIWSNKSFLISFENIFFEYPASYIVSNGMVGINLKKGFNNYFYWINLYDFSETSFGYYFGDKIKIGFFVDTLNKKSDYGGFLTFGNIGIITISKNKVFVEMLSKDINLYFDFKAEGDIIRSDFLKKIKNEFEITLPIIRNDIYFVINSNKKYGIRFDINF
ncbi:hypothetical protein [Marinitoga aeolica]|uniref:Uncharacterized protein n=1 Tax=Marinitoga aeolica TaxID=2809031 RepID=A0ABY8PS23_9BACT|nr:hypothetical protein [Marinitoga aeolica]WGS65425.1 hypothetical protein JRV97_02385 [Marinitoga aeolica]